MPKHLARGVGEIEVDVGRSAPCLEFAPQAGRNRVDERFGAGFRKVVEGDQALAEPVAATPAAKDQGHRSGSDLAIIVADKALQHACVSATAARSGSGRNPLFVSSS